MAKQKSIKNPKITLAECIDELNLINGNIYTLKQGTAQLIEAIDAGDMDHARAVLKVFDLKNVLKNLNPKD